MAYVAASKILNPPTGGQRGDLAAYAIPEDAAYSLRNFVLRNGKVQVREGYSQLGSSLASYPTGIYAYMHNTGLQKIVAATKQRWFRWNSTTQDWVDISPSGNLLSGGNDSHQIFRVFYKSGVAYLLGCNGHSDAPIKWDGTGSEYADIGGSPGNPRCMAVLANRLIMGNFNNYPVMIDVSEFNDFEAGWGAVQQINLYDTPGEIVSINEFGNLAAFVYKSDAIYQCTAVAASYPFTFQLKYAGIPGPMSSRCVVTTPMAHYILARDLNVYRFDGTSYTPIGDHIRAHLLTTLNIDKFDRAWGFFDRQHDEIWFLYPGYSSDMPGFGMVIRMDGTLWPIRFDEFYPTAGNQFMMETEITIGDLLNNIGYYTDPLKDYTSRKLINILCDSTGRVFTAQGYKDNNQSIPYHINTGMSAPSDSHKLVTVVEIDHYTKKPSGSQTMWSTLRYSDEDYLTPSFDTEQSFDISTPGPHVTGHRRTSRFFGLSLSGSAVEEIVWEGAKIQGVERSER